MPVKIGSFCKMFFLSSMLALGGLSVADKVAAHSVTWKVQSNKSAGSVRFALEQAFSKEVAKLTDNTLIIDVRPAHGFVPMRSSFNAVRKGTIQAMFMSPMYWGGADPVFYILGDLVGAWRNPQMYAQWLEQENGIRHLHNAYNKFDLKLLGYTISPLESFVSSVPLVDISSFSGKTIRAAPGMAYDFLVLLGAHPRLISLNQVKVALAKKRVSIADYSNIVANFNDGLHEIVKHTNYPGFHSMPLNDFVVSKKAWQYLTDEQRGAVDIAIKHWSQALNEYYQKGELNTLTSLQDIEVTIYRWDDAKRAQARQIAEQVWDRYAQKGDTARIVLDELKAWLHKTDGF